MAVFIKLIHYDSRKTVRLIMFSLPYTTEIVVIRQKSVHLTVILRKLLLYALSLTWLIWKRYVFKIIFELNNSPNFLDYEIRGYKTFSLVSESKNRRRP